MRPNEASRTAEFNALFRAIESAKCPRSRRLFNDAFAHGFLGKTRYAYYLSRLPIIGNIVPSYIDRKWPGVRTSALGRTCLIDDQLSLAIKDGIRQIVILGSGYDSRAYRLCDSDALRIFEIDHPDTLDVKVRRLKQLMGRIPGNVHLVAVNFDHEDFASSLVSSGFDPSSATFFLWEGVMHYLTADAVDTTLRSIRALSAPGSRLVFTYIHRGLLDRTVEFGNMGHVPATLQKAGESWKFGLHPGEIKAYLDERGFSLTADMGSKEYRLRYLGNSSHSLTGFEFYRLAISEVNFF